jgi:probable F420-dependent oxidoreductase
MPVLPGAHRDIPGRMKIGIVPINVGVFEPEQVAKLATKAEEVGVESLWTFEHVIVPSGYDSKYPYSQTGKMPATPETPFVDPLIALAHAAAVTKKVRLATGVNILPQANPLYLAKQVASIDVLSAGRMMLGVGVGWLREEFDALGVSFERRGARFADYVIAMKKVWSGETVEHESEFLRWTGFKSYPLPVQRPHPPIIVGGTTPAALRRVADLGDGWFAPTGGVDQLAESLAKLREACKAAGRDYDSIEITASWSYSKEGASSLARYRDLGVSRLVVSLFFLDGGPMAGLDKLGDQVISKI